MLPSVDGTQRGVGLVDGRDLPISRAGAVSGELIERDGELATLADALAALEDRIGGVVTVNAPAGLGKTALLERRSPPPPRPATGFGVPPPARRNATSPTA
jgi:hypothetical protein